MSMYGKMFEFSHQNLDAMRDVIAGKVIDGVIIDDDGMDSFLVFSFTDGEQLRIRYEVRCWND